MAFLGFLLSLKGAFTIFHKNALTFTAHQTINCIYFNVESMFSVCFSKRAGRAALPS